MKKSNKIIAALLTLVMLLSIIPAGMITVGAESTVPTINVESVTTKAGKTVEINVEIENNPGILGATFELSYGEGLTLTSAVQGEAFNCLTMTRPGKFTSPCNFVWDGQEIEEDQIKDGVILTLTFDVAEDAEAGTLPITFSYDDGDVIDADLNPVDLEINNGKIVVIDYTPGDLDGNDKINTLDVILLRRYIAGGYDVDLDARAANVNRDEKVNTLDVILIRRFIAGGYVDANGDPLELYPAPVKDEPVISGWVLDSEVPSGAEIVDNKWTYTQRETIAVNSDDPRPGYVFCDTTWEWGPWESWSGWSRTQPTSDDSRQVESKTVTDQAAYTSYKYWIYRTSDGYGFGTQNYYTGSAHGSCTRYDEITINYQLNCVDSSLGLYGYYDSSMFEHSYDNQWFEGGSTYHSAVTHTEYRYRERDKIYTYYFERYVDKESDTDPTGRVGVSNVKHWVKYTVQ